MDKRINNHGAVKHGFGSKGIDADKHKFYDVYLGMIRRCTNPQHTSYKNYGARGIRVLRNSFEEFRADMYESYVKHIKEYGKAQTSLDRIDNDGDYCKENCRWATMAEQRANQRKSLYAVIDGEKYTTRDIAEMCGLCIDGASDRIKRYNQGFISQEQLFKFNRLLCQDG